MKEKNKKKAAATQAGLLLMLMLIAGALGGQPWQPKCSDGVDNDYDGGTDSHTNGQNPIDQQCQYLVTVDPVLGPIYLLCPTWDSEVVASTTQDECLGN